MRAKSAAASAGAVSILALPAVVAGVGSGAEAPRPTSATAPPPPPPPPAEATVPRSEYERVRRKSWRRLVGWRRTERQRNRARAALRAHVDPVRAGLLCIHGGEGSWRDTGDPYWGGLQMDRAFMWAYGRPLVQRLGYAHNWPPAAQLAVAEVAFYSGRGYGPWPNTRRACGL